MRPRSSASSSVSGPADGLPSRSLADPAPESQERRRSGNAATERREHGRRRLEEARLEEPEPVADLVDDTRPPRADLVGLPEDRDLLGELVVDMIARVQAVEQAREAKLRRERAPPRRLGRVRRDYKLERDLRDRFGEPIARDAGLVEL